MEWLAENPLPIWVFGSVALSMALVVFLHTRTNKALAAVVAVVAVTATLLIVERLIETPREAVERTLYELAAAVEANDIPGVLSYLSPTARGELRNDVQTLMPLVEIERARIIGSPQIEPVAASRGEAFLVTCRGLIVATLKQSGMKGAQDDEVSMVFVRSGDRWLVESYESKRNWHRAVGRR